jgi:D-3-phosphoglycerate dehydrogenase / 2-oxoglutarate reductase
MKVLIADDVHASLFGLLQQSGFAYHYEPAISRQQLIDCIANYDGLIIRSKTSIDAAILNQANRLKFIGRAGAGLDLIDLELAKKKGIAVFAANEGNCDAVAEQVVGMLLALLANIAKADREVRQGLWQREANRGYELMNKTVALIGYGHNGRATAKRLSGFGCRVLAYDKYLANYGDAYTQEATMSQIFEQTDILSLHIPLTDETNRMINTAFLTQFSKPIFVINASRGEIAQLSDIATGLQNGSLRGVCLDVLENEKLHNLSPEQQTAFDYLRQSNQVILTPHIAGWTYESYERINHVLVKQMLALTKSFL